MEQLLTDHFPTFGSNYQPPKECLITSYSTYREKQLVKLHWESLGYSSPSEFLARLRSCSVSFDLIDPTSVHLLRKVFFDGLSTDVSRLLIAIRETNLDTTAQKADNIMSTRDNHRLSAH